MRALSYTYDITISCPSWHGLSIMLDICNNFSHEILLHLIPRKLCNKIGDLIKPQEYDKLDRQILNGKLM